MYLAAFDTLCLWFDLNGQLESVANKKHFEHSRTFGSVSILNFFVPGVALKSGLPQKYAFTKKSTIFTQSL